jgi:hypothetical protein
VADTNGTSTEDTTVLQVLGAVGTGIGVLGFVAAFGGGVVYTRAEEAGLPADETVAVVPRESLIATGAKLLLPAAGIALAAVLLLYLYIAIAEAVHNLRLRTNEKAKNALLDQAKADDEEAIKAEEEARTAQDNANRAGDSLRNEGVFDTETSGRMKAALSEHTDTAMDAGNRAAELRAKAEAARKRAAAVGDEADVAVEIQRSTRRTWSTLLLYAGEVIALWLLVPGPDELPEWLVVLTVAGIAALVSGAVYARSDSFVRFAVAAFLAIGVVIGVADYQNLRNDPEVEPAAALRKDGISVAGFFVAETDSRIYLGRADGNSRIVEIPRDSLAVLTIGPLMDKEKALAKAEALARELCADHKEAKKNTAAASSATQTSSNTKSQNRKTQPKAKAARCTVR